MERENNLEKIIWRALKEKMIERIVNIIYDVLPFEVLYHSLNLKSLKKIIFTAILEIILIK